MDALVVPQTGPRCFRPGACHMWADTEAELHEMARKIGLRRGWFQEHRTLPHYDLTIRRRLAAVKAGAVPASLKEYLRRKRGNQPDVEASEGAS